MATLPLPAGLTARPLTMDDAQAAVDLIQFEEREIFGEAYIDLNDVAGHWSRPSFDLARDTIGVLDHDGALVALAEVSSFNRAEVSVAPAHRGRGIGTSLMHWTWAAARAGGSRRIGQPVPVAHAAATELLTANGYRTLWTSWVLRLEHDTSLEPQPLPPGFAIREFVPGQDEQVAFQIIEDAFNEWPNRTPSNLGDWSATSVGRPDFEPWQIQLMVTGDTVVAACNLTMSGSTGWVNEIAVRREYRGRGLARALLARAFDETRARGATATELSTDTRTGALGLYLHVGMKVTAEWQHLSKDL